MIADGIVVWAAVHAIYTCINIAFLAPNALDATIAGMFGTGACMFLEYYLWERHSD